MNVLKPRSRMISIRLSDQEYDDLKNRCVARGARSLSDLARAAMNDLLNGTAGDLALSSRVEDVCEQMRVLHQKLDEIALRLSAIHSAAD
jgi:hypothetical protein